MNVHLFLLLTVKTGREKEICFRGNILSWVSKLAVPTKTDRLYWFISQKKVPPAEVHVHFMRLHIIKDSCFQDLARRLMLFWSKSSRNYEGRPFFRDLLLSSCMHLLSPTCLENFLLLTFFSPLCFNACIQITERKRKAITTQTADSAGKKDAVKLNSKRLDHKLIVTHLFLRGMRACILSLCAASR